MLWFIGYAVLVSQFLLNVMAAQRTFMYVSFTVQALCFVLAAALNATRHRLLLRGLLQLRERMRDDEETAPQHGALSSLTKHCPTSLPGIDLHIGGLHQLRCLKHVLKTSRAL